LPVNTVSADYYVTAKNEFGASGLGSCDGPPDEAVMRCTGQQAISEHDGARRETFEPPATFFAPFSGARLFNCAVGKARCDGREGWCWRKATSGVALQMSDK
jgi:hypothetical protein